MVWVWRRMPVVETGLCGGAFENSAFKKTRSSSPSRHSELGRVGGIVVGPAFPDTMPQFMLHAC